MIIKRTGYSFFYKSFVMRKTETVNPYIINCVIWPQKERIMHSIINYLLWNHTEMVCILVSIVWYKAKSNGYSFCYRLFDMISETKVKGLNIIFSIPWYETQSERVNSIFNCLIWSQSERIKHFSIIDYLIWN